MNGNALWDMDVEREEQERQERERPKKLSSLAGVLSILWDEALEKDPGLPEKMGVNLVTVINDIVTC